MFGTDPNNCHIITIWLGFQFYCCVLCFCECRNDRFPQIASHFTIKYTSKKFNFDLWAYLCIWDNACETSFATSLNYRVLVQMLCRSNQINGDDNQTTLWYLSIHFHLLHNVFVFCFFLWEAGYVARTSSSLQQHSPPPGTIPRHPRAKWDISSLLCVLGLPPDHLPAGHPPGGVPEGSPIRLAEPPQLAQHTATLVLSSSRTSPPCMWVRHWANGGCFGHSCPSISSSRSQQ